MKTTRIYTVTETRVHIHEALRFVDRGDEVLIINMKAHKRAYRIVPTPEDLVQDKPRRRRKTRKEAA